MISCSHKNSYTNIITVKPTVENCEPLYKYQKSTPNEYSFKESPILYGGGRKLTMYSQNSNSLKYIALAHQKPIEVDIFVMDVNFIIWLNDYNKGIEISYSCIEDQAILKDGITDSLELGLQVTNTGIFESDESSILLKFKPIYHQDDRYYNQEIEQLFTYEYFGLNKGNKIITNTFHAIKECSNLIDADIDIDINDENYVDIGNTFGYDNSGSADDISEIEHRDTNNNIFSQLRGITRKRDEIQERNQSPKKIKC